jgi:hypothetical protein
MAEQDPLQSAQHNQFGARTRHVLEGVPQIGFELQKLKPAAGLNRCPETTPFASCLRACLEFLGDGYGHREIEAEGKSWRLDNAYAHLMGVTGLAFRLTWKPGWHPDNPDIFRMSDDPLEPVRRGFHAVGYGHEVLYSAGSRDDEARLRERIIESIFEKRRPVIAQGVVGPPESCLVAGYDENGEVLIGWSFFQDFPPFNAGVEFDALGYFRKRDWFRDTPSLILIGDKNPRPPRHEVYPRALAWALDVVRRPVVSDGRHSGLAAYTAWAEGILNDGEFPADDIDSLRARYEVHDDAAGIVAEGRWYAAQFLKQVAEDEKAMASNLAEAVRCYEAEHDLVWKIWRIFGGPGRSDDSARKLFDPGVRRETAAIILEARSLDEEAAGHIETALQQF